MILAAGLTPAWQRVLEFDQLEFGKVNRARRVSAFPSGKVINVGLTLHKLAVPSVTLAPLGGPSGERIRADCERQGVQAEWVRTCVETRICTTLIDAAGYTELVEPGEPLREDELNAVIAAWRRLAATASVAVITGSVPQGTPADCFQRMLRAASPTQTVLDLKGDELLAAVACSPLVAKPNRQELATTLHRPLPTDADLLEAMQELRRLGAQWVVVTDEERPVHALGPAGLYRLTPPPAGQIVNPIGCGDCMTAGLACGLYRGMDVLAALTFGLACAADRLRHLSPSDVDALRAAQLAREVEVCKL